MFSWKDVLILTDKNFYLRLGKYIPGTKLGDGSAFPVVFHHVFGFGGRPSLRIVRMAFRRRSDLQ